MKLKHFIMLGLSALLIAGCSPSINSISDTSEFSTDAIKDNSEDTLLSSERIETESQKGENLMTRKALTAFELIGIPSSIEYCIDENKTEYTINDKQYVSVLSSLEINFPDTVSEYKTAYDSNEIYLKLFYDCMQEVEISFIPSEKPIVVKFTHLEFSRRGVFFVMPSGTPFGEVNYFEL